MKRTKTAAVSMLLALAAAGCGPHDGAAYAQAPRPAAAVTAYPQPSINAVADGNVHEYH